MSITGVPVGGSGTFQETPDPPGSSITGVPTYSSSDPLVTLGPSPDADPTKVVTSCAAGNTNTSFVLTVSGTNTAGTAISTPFTIPLLPAAPPLATGFSLAQLS